MNEPKITHIRTHFQGTAKGKRKIEFQSVHITQLPDHVELTPDQVTTFERLIFSRINALGYKNLSRIELVINFGWDKGPNIVSMEMLPKQRIALLR